MWRRWFLFVLLAVFTTLSASAFERPFPATTKRGVMTPARFPQIVMDGKTRHLSPGARIWNQDNLIEMPASLRGTELVVNYTENNDGDIDRVWILTAEEVRQPLTQQTNSMFR